MTSSDLAGDTISAWLRQHAIPLRHVEAGSGFDDLQPLRQLWQDARVIGLGESTHGTREFFQVKHRLLEFLVTEMEFTVFALEASHTACEPVNAWIQGGIGDLGDLLSGLHYLAWHTEEFVALVEWMREWNAGAPEGRRITFLGADLTYNERGRRAVLNYLQRVAPEKVPETERIFDVLAAGEAKWPLQIDETTDAAVQHVLPSLDRLTAWLDDSRSKLASKSAARESDQIRFYLHLMSQWWVGGPTGRTRCIGANLVHLLDRDHPGEECVFWAHNGHVDAGTYPDGEPKAGQRLRERFGEGYYACALEFGDGSYQYRIIDANSVFGDLTTATIGEPLDGTVPWHLARAGIGSAQFDLRATPSQAEVREWISTRQPMHAIGWAAASLPPLSGDYEDVTLESSFDGIIFIEHTSPVRPTATARKHAARGECM